MRNGPSFTRCLPHVHRTRYARITISHQNLAIALLDASRIRSSMLRVQTTVVPTSMSTSTLGVLRFAWRPGMWFITDYIGMHRSAPQCRAYVSVL